MTTTKPSTRSWRSMSLRTLLLLMLASGCVLGLIGRESREAKRRAQIAEDLSKAAEKIDVEYVNFFGRPTSSPPPDWLATLLGEPFFQQVTAVVIRSPNLLPKDGSVVAEPPRDDLRTPIKPALLPGSVLGELKHLRKFEVSPWGAYGFTDNHAAGLESLRKLETVSFANAQVTDKGVIHLSPENPLRSLNLARTLVGDAGLAHLAGFDSLEELDLTDTLVTDPGMRALAALPNLRTLRLDRVMVSDKGIRTLTSCPNLETLHLARLPLTADALTALADFPRLKTLRLGDVSRPDGEVAFLGKQLEMLRAKDGQLAALRCLGPPSVFWAIHRSHAPRNTPYLRWLLEHGADPDEKTHNNISAVLVLTNRKAPEPAGVLAEFGADLNAADSYGRTPLSVAAGQGDLAMIHYLARLGAKTDPARGHSPLAVAASRRQTGAVRLLLEIGADVHGATRAGDTALHLAVRHNAPEAVRFLLAHGADPHRKNPQGHTPLAIAEKARMWEIADVLKGSAE
ncbi:MAG: ankyrin repeat domain-containing protein [Planctomycetes bacterium]|nr:ankyrin repeat domain-containing protein [Planctomycetota bacterium]